MPLGARIWQSAQMKSICDRKTAGALKIEDLLNRSLFALSGGEKQKVACASVSAMEPDIFVLDEPSSNLDIKSIRELKDVLRKWKAQGKTIVIAEHRLYYLMDIADRILYMQGGQIKRKPFHLRLQKRNLQANCTRWVLELYSLKILVKCRAQCVRQSSYISGTLKFLIKKCFRR